jgi:hypothetical protein
MTAAQFRIRALALPGVIELSHKGHPDFRVHEKIFATIGPDGSWAMVKLTPDQQATFLRDNPELFQPASGAWGRNGATIVRLAKAPAAVITLALHIARENITARSTRTGR